MLSKIIRFSVNESLNECNFYRLLGANSSIILSTGFRGTAGFNHTQKRKIILY